MSIGKIIKKRREELGYTQEQLAQKMGYKSKSTINKIEAGINDITQSKIVEFARVLKTTPAYLMGWEEDLKVPEEKKSFDPYFVDTSMLTAEELAEFNRVTGVNKQLFFNDVDEEHDMALFKQSVVEILIKQRDKKKK